jgi:hypothetical protein
LTEHCPTVAPYRELNTHAANAMRASCTPPLVALTGTSESSPEGARVHLVRRNHLDLTARAASLRGLYSIGRAEKTNRISSPLVPLASRSEFERERICRPATPPEGDVSELARPLVGFFPPFDVSNVRQRPTPGFHPRLCSAFRFSQPLDALLRLSPLRPCFVPVTSMGLASTAGFPRW